MAFRARKGEEGFMKRAFWAGLVALLLLPPGALRGEPGPPSPTPDPLPEIPGCPLSALGPRVGILSPWWGERIEGEVRVRGLALSPLGLERLYVLLDRRVIAEVPLRGERRFFFDLASSLAGQRGWLLVGVVACDRQGGGFD